MSACGVVLDRFYERDVVVLHGSWSHAHHLAGREAGELGPLAAEVSLIVIAAGEGDARPRAAGPHRIECALEAPDSHVSLWRHPDVRAEHLDQPAPAELQRARDASDLDARLLESSASGG